MTYEARQQDCLEFLGSFAPGSVDLIVTSPPYNIGKSYEKKSLLSFDEYLIWQGKVIQAAALACSTTGSICWQVGNYITPKGAVVPLDCALFEKFTYQNLIPRNRIIWTFNHGLHCKNRFSGRHETILWFSKSDDYVFNLDPVRVPQKYKNKKYFKGLKKGQLSCNPLGANPGDTWAIPNVKHNHPEKLDHPCQFPYELASRLVLALTGEGGLVVDPFMGSGTTGAAAVVHNRRFLGSDTDASYVKMASERMRQAEDGFLNARTGFYADEQE